MQRPPNMQITDELDDELHTHGMPSTPSDKPWTLNKVASFLGIENDKELNRWRDRFLVRVESNNIGFKMKNLLPIRREYENVDNLLSGFQRQIDEVTVDRNRLNRIIDTYFPENNTNDFHSSDVQSKTYGKGKKGTLHFSLAKLPSPHTRPLDGKSSSAPQVTGTPEPNELLIDAKEQDEVDTGNRYMELPEENETLFEDACLSEGVSNFLGEQFSGSTSSGWKISSRLNGELMPKIAETFSSDDEVAPRTNFNSVHRDSAEQPVESVELLEPIASSPTGQNVQISPHRYLQVSKYKKEVAVLCTKSSPSDVKTRKSSVTFSSTVKEYHSKERGPSANFMKSIFKRPASRKVQTKFQSTEKSGLPSKQNPIPKSILKINISRDSPRKGREEETEEYAEVRLSDKNDLFQPSEWLYAEKAWQHYLTFRQAEKEEKVTELRQRKDRIAGQIQKQIDDLKNGMDETESYVNDEPVKVKGRVETVVDFFRSLTAVGPYSPRMRPTHSENSAIARQMENMPVYKPWFTYIVSALQLLTMILLMAMGNIAPIGMVPEVTLRHDTLTFQGLADVHHWEIKNPWLGPSLKFLIHAGAVFAPCMRNDNNLFRRYAQKYEGPDKLLGCCEVKNRNTAGTTTKQECDTWAGNADKNWISGVKCSLRSPKLIQVPHVIKPCCYGLKAQCEMVTLEHCVFIEGHFFPDGPDHCSQANCLSKICGFAGLTTDKEKPYQPSFANQVWRLWLALLLHHGFLEVILIIILQLIICRQLETMAGWFRILLIYVSSGSLGFLTAGTMTPYLPHVGASGSLFALIAVLYVELAQSWELVLHPWVEICKLSALTCSFLLMGTVPFLDNFGLLACFMYGLLLGVIFLPYITFGKWHTYRKRILVGVCFLLFTFITLTSFIVFFDVQAVTEWCSSTCRYITCIPYADNLCEFPEDFPYT